MVTTIGMILLLLINLYFLVLSVKLVLIGVGKVENLITKNIENNKQFLFRGIIGLVVTIPFICFLIFIFIQVFLV